MILSFRGPGRAYRIEESGLVPPTAGEFLASSIERRHLNRELVAKKTGLSRHNLDAIINNDVRIDRKNSKKLERVFPGMGKMLVRLQEYRRFYDQYGVIRPQTMIGRAAVVRAFRLKKPQSSNHFKL